MSQIEQIETSVQRMADLHARHVQAQTPLQRRVSRATAVLANPRVAALLLLGVLLWILLNTAAPYLGWKALDAPPFAILETAATVVALFTTMMILATQAREEQAARERSQLTLQLATLSEQKIAKVIRLLEEQRSENPQLSSRRDHEAEAMAQPSDPAHVLERIRDTHDDI